MGHATVFSIVRFALRAVPVAAAMLVATGCGSKSPSSPSNDSSGSIFTPSALATVPVYVGQVQLPDGVSGTLVLRPSASFSALASPKVLDVIVGLFEASLHAQGSATGKLLLPTDVIDLSGTYNGGTFSVSGGGYALTVAQSGGSVSGTGTAPQGSGVTVSAPPPPNTGLAPAPSDASGIYKGTFSLVAPAHSRTTSMATGALVEDCVYSTVVSGTLTVQLKSAGSGTYTALLLDDWKESDGPPGKCNPRLPISPDPYTEFQGATVAPAGPHPAEAPVSATALQITWAESGTFNGGPHSRAATLIGSVSGATVVAQYSRNRSFSNPRAQTLSYSGGYQGSVDVTLVKQ